MSYKIIGMLIFSKRLHSNVWLNLHTFSELRLITFWFFSAKNERSYASRYVILVRSLRFVRIRNSKSVWKVTNDNNNLSITLRECKPGLPVPGLPGLPGFFSNPKPGFNGFENHNFRRPSR